MYFKPPCKKERLLKETLLDSTLKGVVADILLLHSYFLERVFYHTSGDLTKSSEQSRGRFRDHQAESGKKWTHKGELEGRGRQKTPSLDYNASSQGRFGPLWFSLARAQGRAKKQGRLATCFASPRFASLRLVSFSCRFASPRVVFVSFSFRFRFVFASPRFASFRFRFASLRFRFAGRKEGGGGKGGGGTN